MSHLPITNTFRALDDASRLPNNYVNPYYLEDLKRLVAVARVDGKLYAFDDLYEGAPLSSGLLTGHTLMSQTDGSQFDGKLYAFDDLYEGAPLSSGLLTGHTLMSQTDGSQFDVTTGAVLRGPASEPLELYAVREEGGKIKLLI